MRPRNKWRTPTSRAEKIAKRRDSFERMLAGEGFVYAAEVPGTQYVKLGFSLRPEKRVGNIFTYRIKKKAGPMRLIAKAPCSFAAEKAMHKQLRDEPEATNYPEFYHRSVLNHPAVPAELRRATP